MIVRFDSLDRLEKPRLTLCNPGSTYSDDNKISKAIGVLVDHEAEEVSFNFNATSELNFRLNRVPRADMEENQHVLSLYKAVQNRRLIFLNDIGYFVITQIEEGFDGVKHYKDIKAQSADIEIQQKTIPYIEDGTYRLVKSSTDTGDDETILDMIVSSLPLWTIGHVDTSLYNKYRTFEDVDVSTNCLAFLLENVQDAYECIVLFDIVNRVINIYDQNNYIKRTNIHLTKNDIINSIDISEDADDLYTAISVTGNDDITISAVNPTGLNTIYDFTYYLDWMSPSLRAAIKAWTKAIKQASEGIPDEQDPTQWVQRPYSQIGKDYYDALKLRSDYQQEVQRLDMQLTMYQRCRDNIVAERDTRLVDEYNAAITEAGGDPIIIQADIEATLAEIDGHIATVNASRTTALSNLNNANETVSNLQSQITSINGSVNLKNFVTSQELMDELSQYIYQGNYTDEYVTITEDMPYDERFDQMELMYNRAKIQLEKISRPTQEFSIDTENFIFDKDFKQWSDQLETGCLINVELEEDDIALLFLSNITLNYDDHKLSLTFGNRFNKFDPKSLFEDMLGQISKSSNTLSYVKDLLYPVKSGEIDAMREVIDKSRTITMAGAMSASNEEVVIDNSGYTGRTKTGENSYDPRQIKITGQNIVFTDDAWQNAKTAIGELILGDGQSTYGINAETIIGKLIVGSGLVITDSDGNNLIEALQGELRSSIGSINDQLTQIKASAEGVDIRVSNLETQGVDSVTTTNRYTFNSDGLQIAQEGSEIANRIDNTGMYVSRSGEVVLQADASGVNAMNLKSRQYLEIGDNSRFENYSNGTDLHRTACFYNYRGE